MLYAVILGWLGCSCLAYLLFRYDCSKNLPKIGLKYKVKDRLFGIFLSLIGGPAALGAALVIVICGAISNISWDKFFEFLDREAKW